MVSRVKFQKLFPVPFTSVSIEDRFWKPRLKAHKETTIPVCLHQCEITGRIANFAKAAGLMEGEHEGIYFNDSDVYKVLEGIAYSLMNHPDQELEQKADAIIDLIVAAQEEDGYLMTYYTLKAPEHKWTDMEKHELYCGGHLIEAAVAYYQATGKRKILDAVCRLADHYDSVFGPGKRHWVEGHQEIELALVKLYHLTGEERYWKLALWLLEERGHGHGVGMIWSKEDWGPAYCQDHLPVRDQSRVTGHAVRAMYQYTGMADVALVNGDQGYIDALHRLWDNVVNRNMYITGGIGPSKHNEGFTEDYDMPNAEAYCETCASVGMAMWNHRMLLLHGDAKYADVMERAMYNGAIAGVSLEGNKFFYVNPLASDGSHHRVEWYNCSCCPTQIARFLPSVGNYVYATSDDSIWVNLYLEGDSSIAYRGGTVNLSQRTEYPWDGRVTLNVQTEGLNGHGRFQLRLRIPGWCKSASVAVNGLDVQKPEIDKGFLVLSREWLNGDTISLDLHMPVERNYAHPKVKANIGRVALTRGPLVYCLEQADNGFDLEQFTLHTDAKLTIHHDPELLGGVTVIVGAGVVAQQAFTAVPYYAWDNREPGAMAVWVHETKQTEL